MSKKRVKKGNSIEKIILLILFIVLAVLVVYAFKDNFIKEDKKEIINKKENKETKKKDEEKTNDNSSIENKTESTSTNKVDNSEPKKSEKEETKQQLQENVTVNIELIGSDEITLKVGDKYKELGVKAIDSNGKDISSQVSIDNGVDTSKQGEYMVIYSIGKSSVIRTVIVK